MVQVAQLFKKLLLPSSGNTCNCTASHLGTNNKPLFARMTAFFKIILTPLQLASLFIQQKFKVIVSTPMYVYCTQSSHAVF